MLLRMRILITSFGTALLLLVVLCLGSQNLNDRQKLKLGVTTTAALPNGFLVGISIVLGFISGGSMAAFLIPKDKN